jgi:hypothetical protein
LLVASCAKTPDHEGYYGLFGELEPGIEIYVNGNPTDEGQNLSLFIVQGENHIDLRGPFKERGFTLTVRKTKDFYGIDGKTITTAKRNLEEAKENSGFSFEEPTWWRWAWQDADLLDSDLTGEDRKQIHGIVDDLCNKVANRQFGGHRWVEEPFIRYWGDDRQLVTRAVEAESEALTQLQFPEPIYFSRVSPKEIEFLVGSQIVMVRSLDGALLSSLGPEPLAESSDYTGGFRGPFYYGIKVMFFSRFEGNWSFLLPVIW